MMADSHEITVRNYKQPMRNRLIMMLICIGIALTSFLLFPNGQLLSNRTIGLSKRWMDCRKKHLGFPEQQPLLQQVLQQYREKPQLRSRISWQMSQAIWWSFMQWSLLKNIYWLSPGILHLKSYFLLDACFWQQATFWKTDGKNLSTESESRVSFWVFFCGDWFLPVHGWPIW